MTELDIALIAFSPLILIGLILIIYVLYSVFKYGDFGGKK